VCSILDTKSKDKNVTKGALLKDSMKNEIVENGLLKNGTISGNYSSYNRVMNNNEHQQMAVKVDEASSTLDELRQRWSMNRNQQQHRKNG
jgi:hypothetical protein